MVSTPNWRRGILFFLTFACLIFRIKAQLPEVYSKLNIERSCKDFLWIGSTGKGMPPNAQNNTTVQTSETQELLFQMLRSRAESCEQLPDFRSLQARRRDVQQEQSAIPLVILEAKYQRFKSNALENKLVYLDNGFLKCSNDQSNDAFETHQTLILDLGTTEISAHEKWYWDPSFFLTNEGDFPDAVRINFGDGWQTLSNKAQLLSANFSDATSELLVQLEVTRNGVEKKVQVVVKTNTCHSIFPSPHSAPWPQESADFPWQFSVDNMKANAYTLWSEDGVFDKPFIFVEGIDFEYNHSAEKNGKFGWCQFTGGFVNGQMEFPMLAQLPVLLHDLREMGFDIIMLDFYDGAARIEDNGKLLEELIEKCKAYREGSEAIVVAGASMGGQVARYTLRSMEMEGKNHCTSLFISLDSPHQGAYIPAALQETIYELSSYVSEAAVMVDNKLLRPAARQMLIYQINQPLLPVPTAGMYLEWKQWKDEHGLPQLCRNIALANGSASGETLIPNTSDMLLDYGCEFEGEYPLIKLDLYPLPGNSTHEASNPFESVIADITFTENLGLFNGSLTGINQYILRPTVHPNWKKWDYAPGGTRKSISEFVDALNQNDDFTSQCSAISEDEYNKNHCFVSTASALDIPDILPNAVLNSVISNNPEICAFDKWFIQSANQQHVEVSQESIDWIEDEVFAGVQENGDSWLPNIFSGEENSFNFYTTSFSRVPSIVISGQAHVMINNHVAGHYNDQPPALNSHFQATLGGLCGSETITLTSEGKLTLGDDNGVTRGDLIIERDGLLRILDGSVCTVNLGSKLILREGANVLIDFHGLLELNGGELVLEKGSKIIFRNGNILMNHSNSKIHFKGGIIQIEEAITWSPFNLDAPSHGKFVIYAEGDDDIVLTENVVLNLEGFNGQDEAIVFEPMAHFSCTGVDGSSLRVRSLKAQMNHSAEWAINLNSSFVNCFVESDFSEARVSMWGYQTHLEKSRFNNVYCFLNNTSTYANKCIWDGVNAGVSAVSASYSFNYCQFKHCGMASSSMDEECHLDHCDFDGFYGESKGFTDKGTARIFITDCDWKRYSIATEKLSGRLYTKCSTWEDNTNALVIQNDAKWIASRDMAGGYNHFTSNETHVLFVEAGTPELNNGYNRFDWAGVSLFEGSIADMNCAWSCAATPLYAHFNQWDEQLLGHYNLHTLLPCSSNHPCGIKVFDFYPTIETNCQVSEMFALERRSDVEGVAAWESKERKAATLFPNPSSGEVRIEGVPNSEIVGVTIYNAQGQLCPLIQFQDQSKNTFSVDHLTPGVYTVRIECTDRLVPLCLVVE